jgi:hypothetical protein
VYINNIYILLQVARLCGPVIYNKQGALLLVCIKPCADMRADHAIVCAYLSLPICILFCILSAIVQQGGRWDCQESWTVKYNHMLTWSPVHIAGWVWFQTYTAQAEVRRLRGPVAVVETYATDPSERSDTQRKLYPFGCRKLVAQGGEEVGETGEVRSTKTTARVGCGLGYRHQ